MALRLGFCFQPSSERGSTYRTQCINHQSQVHPAQLSPTPRALAFGAQTGMCSWLCLGQKALALVVAYPTSTLYLPHSRRGHTDPICEPSGRCPICLRFGAVLGELGSLPHRGLEWGRVGVWAAHLVTQKSSHTGLRGVTDGCEVMATLQGQHHCTSCQAHQLLCHVPKT